MDADLEPLPAPRAVFDRLDERGEQPRYLVDRSGQWQPVTWREHAEQIEDVAFACEHLGLRPTEPAAILADNRVEWMAAALGIQAAGGVAVPVQPTMSEAQIVHVLAHAEARLVLVDSPERLELVRRRATELPSLRAAVVIDPSHAPEPSTRAPAVVDWATVRRLGRDAVAGDPERSAARLDAVDPEQPALMLYTSGTTGRPKGVPLSHAALALNWAEWIRNGAPGLHPGAVDLLWLPMCHVFGYGEAHTGNVLGFTTYLCEPHGVLERLPQLRPSVFLAVPSYWEKLATPALARPEPTDQVRALREACGGNLRFCLSGGARLSPEVKALYHRADIPLIEGYGLTECSPTLTVERPGTSRPGSVGVPLPSVELRLADDGEVQARGPTVFRGYHRDPEATAAAFTPEGWFRTGDLGRLDEHGSLHLVGRSKELLVTSGGKNVAPVPIEERLRALPWVEHALLYGDGKKFLSAGLWLDDQAVARTLGPAAAPEAVQALVDEAVGELNEGLARFERIRKTRVMERPLSVEDGHLTPTLKLRRHRVYAAFHDELEALYAEGTTR